jgi:hypothetical protein
MKKNYFSLLFLSIMLLVLFACNKSGIQLKSHGNFPNVSNSFAGSGSFKIYGFIVYGGYVQSGVNVNASYAQIQTYLLPYGINKLNLIYEQNLLDYPGGVKANAVPNVGRIDSLANLAKADPTTLVSLDMESWNRFDTVATPSKYVTVINDWKAIDTLSQLGLYATVPQNTYGYTSTIHNYDKYNKAYSSVAAKVDYFGPSLYNYNGVDSVAWKSAAAYNVSACTLYGFTSKRILPYITPEVTVNGVTTELSYNDMMLRLQYLYSLGANGCLVWTSSATRDASGNKIYVDVTTGWAKALVDFATSHP